METPQEPRKRSHRALWAGTALLLVIGGGTYWLWQEGRLGQTWMSPLANLTMLGRGTPLETQQANIEVLEEGVALPMPTSNTAAGASEGLAAPRLTNGSTRIDMVTSGTTDGGLAANQVAHGPVDDVTGLKLGTTLALLTQAYANGGPLARTLANTAHELALQAQSGGRAPEALVDALMVLRTATPQVGPMTGLALVAESQRVIATGAPEGEQTTTAAATDKATDGWWQRQLEKFVTIKRGNEPQMTDWTRQMVLVQQQLARGAGTDALANLMAAPLADDGRLDMLRTMVREYLDQQGKLQNAMTVYTQTYLLRDAAGTR